MTGWHADRARGGPKIIIAVTLLALLLVAAVPAALLAGVVMMLLGHVAGGLALFGGTALAASAGVVLAGMSGMRRLRKLVSANSLPVMRLDERHYGAAEADCSSGNANVMRLDRSEYTEVP
jgi:hypothetical protein